MSDKFLGTGGNNTSLTNGTAVIYASTLGANTLDPSRPVKTNSVRQLVSSNLDISEINTLSTQLTEKDELNFVEDDTHTNPVTGKVKIYAKTDGEMYKLNSEGVETPLGGGGIETVNAPVVNDSLVFYSGTSGDQLKYVQNMKFVTGVPHGDQLKVPDVQTDEHTSLNSSLEKLANITSATQNPDIITNFDGEIHVAKIKSKSDNTNLEFGPEGSAILEAETSINFYSNFGFTFNGNNVLTSNELGDYLRTDGTVAMTGNLNMGNRSINDLTGLQGITNIPVVIFGPLQNPPKTVLSLDYDEVKLGTSLDLDNNTIKNVAPPNIGTDAANKDYVDSQAGGPIGPITGELEVKNFTPSSYPVADKNGGTGGIIVVGDATTGVNKQGIIYYDNTAQTMAINSLISPLVLAGSSVSSSSDFYSNAFRVGALGQAPGGMVYDQLGTNRIYLEGSFRAQNLQADLLKVETRKASYAGQRFSTATIYTDDYMTFQWDGTNSQLKFSPQSATDAWWDAGLRISKMGGQNTSLNSFDDILTYPGTYYYFTQNGTLDTQYNFGGYGNFGEYFIMTESGSINLPSYRIKVINGSASIHILIDKTIP